MALTRQTRRTAAQFTSDNPTLAAGWLGIETDTGKFKIGDGATAWTSLSYAAASPSDVVGLLDLKGSTDCSSNPNYPSASKGDLYVVSVAGKIGGASGTTVSVGDAYFALADNAGGTQAAVGASWSVLEANIASASALLDTIGSTRGAILYRGAAGWAILAPGTATHVLTSNGAGADPSYQAPGGGGSGGTFVPLTEAQRNASQFSGSLVNNTFVTISNANLTGASAKAALILINDVVDWTAGGAALDLATAEYYGRATGSGDIEDAGNNYVYDKYFRISAGNYTEEHHHMIVVPCGTAGNAGKFDIEWIDGSGAFDTMSRSLYIVGYWT